MTCVVAQPTNGIGRACVTRCHSGQAGVSSGQKSGGPRGMVIGSRRGMVSEYWRDDVPVAKILDDGFHSHPWDVEDASMI